MAGTTVAGTTTDRAILESADDLDPTIQRAADLKAQVLQSQRGQPDAWPRTARRLAVHGPTVGPWTEGRPLVAGVGPPWRAQPGCPAPPRAAKRARRSGWAASTTHGGPRRA